MFQIHYSSILSKKCEISTHDINSCGLDTSLVGGRSGNGSWFKKESWKGRVRSKVGQVILVAKGEQSERRRMGVIYETHSFAVSPPALRFEVKDHGQEISCEN